MITLTIPDFLLTILTSHNSTQNPNVKPKSPDLLVKRNQAQNGISPSGDDKNQELKGKMPKETTK